MYLEERNPFFKVRKENVQTASGIAIPNKVALVNESLDTIVGFVSPNYDVVENNVIAEMFEAALNDFKIASVNDHLDASTRRWKRQIILEKDSLGSIEVLPADVVGVMLEVYNGYDARTAYGYSLMGYRWACTNGLVTGKKDLMSESFAHYDGNVERLRASFDSKFRMFGSNAEIWSKWSTESFNQAEFDKFVNSVTKPTTGRARKNQYLTERISKTVKDQYQPLLAKQNMAETKWGAFNVLTWLASHETKARNGSNLFSNRYGTYSRLAGDFYSDNERALVVV